MSRSARVRPASGLRPSSRVLASGVVASLGVFASCGGPAPDARGGETFRLEPVADGVYATVVRDGISPSQFGASLIVLRSDHVLVVDSRHDAASADELIATIRGLTELPVRYVVNTHWHGDHVQGNVRFREAFPDVRLVGGATIAGDMETLGRQRLAEQGLDIELVPPEITVEHELRLDDGEPVIEIVKVGPAHTRGDVIVRVPSRGVIAIGDLIEDGFPWFGDGYPSAWATALDRIAAMLAEGDGPILVGGHTSVLRDLELFETQREFVRRIAVAAADASTAAAAGSEADVDPGTDGAIEAAIEAAIAAADVAEFRDHFTRRMAAASEQERTERFDAFLAEVMERALAEASGELAEDR